MAQQSPRLQRPTAGTTLAVGRLLAAVALAVALPMSIMTVITVRQLVVDARQRDANEVRTIATQVARRLDDLVHEYRGVLTVAAHTVRPDIGDLRMRDSLLAAISRDLPPYITNLSLYSRDGVNLGHTFPYGTRERALIADRAYFMSALQTKRLTIGAPIVSRLTGRRVVAVVLPVVGFDNSVRAIVAATLELDRLLQLLELPKLPEQSVVSVIDTGGFMVARSVDARNWVGRNVAYSESVRQILTERSGEGDVTGLDGVRRYETVGASQEAPWVVTVGVPPELVYGQASARTTQGVLTGILSLLGGLALAAYFAQRIGRPVRRLTQDAIAFGHGDATRRADVEAAGPMRPLAVAFNGMADELEKRARDSENSRRLAESSEAQLRQVQKMEAVGQLAGGVAHDFNNLLTVILSHVYFARDELSKLEQGNSVGESLSEIQAAAARAAELTRQLLTFARRQPMTPQIVDLNQITTGIDRLLRRVLGEDIELATLLSPALWQTAADATQVEQILINLAVNARDAMPDGGRLTIETGNVVLGKDYAEAQSDVTPGEYVMASVTDTGTGIAAEHLPRIFEPFFTTKPLGAGTGLGLAVCYGIAKQHGGHIAACSELGHGATFRLYLPRTARASAAAVQVDGTTPAQGGSETILLVEDMESVRSIAARTLQQQGYQVLTAGDGVDGIRVADAFGGPIDLVLTDMVMPRVGGRELAAALKARRPDIKVLYTSGYAKHATLTRHGPGVSEPFLAKPYVPEVLLRKVRGVLDGAPGNGA